MPSYAELSQIFDQQLSESRRRRALNFTGEPDMENLTRADIAESLFDYCRLKTRRVQESRAHPIALEAHKDGLSLLDLQERSSITSSEFGNLLADSLSVLVQTAFSAADEIAPVVRDIRVRDFQPVHMGSMDIGAASEIGDDMPLPKLGFIVREAPRKGQLREFGGSIGFSRATMSTYSDEIPQAFADHAALTLPAIERQLLATALENAPCPNVSTALTVAGMDALSNLLRSATNAAGQILNLAPRTVIVPAELETTARVLIGSMWVGGPPALGILVVPELSSATRYWLVCDPRRSAPLTRLRLQGANTPTVYRHTTPEGNTALALRIETDVLYTSQPGMVRGGA